MDILPAEKDTIVCMFDKEIPRITAYDILEWIYQKLRLEPEDVATIQIDDYNLDIIYII